MSAHGPGPRSESSARALRSCLLDGETAIALHVPSAKELAHCTIRWTALGLARISFDASDPLYGDAPRPPEWVLAVRQKLEAHLGGVPQTYAEAVFDERALSPFAARVLRCLRHVPEGSRITYSELATSAGFHRAYRAVGTAVGRNPWPLVVPCHRVISTTGLGGFSLPGGALTKAWLLSLESRKP